MEKQIESWLNRGVITKDQAEIMRRDVKESKKLNSQNHFIIAVSIIGAALLGIGAILFISSNWQYMPPMVKVIILSISTFGIYALGYYFRYEKRNFPNVGSALLFLSALLIGASIFLVTQIYNYQANTHMVVLIWLLLLLPFLYTIRTYVIGSLVTLVFYFWFFLFLQQTFENQLDSYSDLSIVMSLYFFASLVLLSLGTLHKGIPMLDKVGRSIKWISVQIALIILFYFSFDHEGLYGYNVRNSFILDFSNALDTTFILLISAALILASAAWLLIRRENARMYEFALIVASIFMVTLFVFNPENSTVFAIFFNVLIFGVCLALIYAGYEREDIKIVNLGVFWVCALIIVRYFDFFWDLLDRSIFFLFGGTVLIIGAVFLEKARRNLKHKFVLSHNHEKSNG